MSDAATSRFCTTACEFTPAPLVAALALLGISGMMMMASAGAGGSPQAPSTTPVAASPAKATATPAAAAAAATTPAPTVPPSEVPKVQLRLEADGKLYFKDDELTEEDVMADLSGSSAAVILLADEKAPLPALLEVMRWLKNARVSHTSVELQKPAP